MMLRIPMIRSRSGTSAVALASHKWALDVGNIDSLRPTEGRLTKVRIADCSLHDQIDIAPNDGAKIVMQRAEVLKRIGPAGKEIDEEVDVAVRAS
ncbi:hypothetical protein [Pseudoglutamicibacter cumminsii]|uniref:hypothetical protein n=1 Tax=Pseudoglutamicibacter cumminsii TaxID=156979 RepID=UPI0015E8203E|nr:hypothetical protein [Pseudoglutamicibacter cumminsii]